MAKESKEIQELDEQIQGLKEPIRAVEEQIWAVDEQIKAVGDPDEKKQLREKENHLRDEKKQLLGEKRLRATPGSSDALTLLLERYQVTASRSRSRDSALEEPEYDALEPGQNFDIVGREGTYEVLLKGAGQMYARFCSPADEATYRAGSFFLALVAFPGAGKTTLGMRGWRYLVESWKEMPQQRKVELLKGGFEAFDDLVQESIKFNLLMYHEVESESGGVVSGERGLGVSQILGLRTLYMIIHDNESRTRYSDFLSELDAHLPGVKQQASFGLAMEFLARVLELKKRVMATFFFDEVNSINATLSGEQLGEKGAASTWFQELMSEYVREHFLLAERKESLVFPVFSFATTRFPAGDLSFTRSRNSTSILVPLPPLSEHDAQTVVLRFLQSLARREGLPSPSDLTRAVKLMIRLSGGMPRYISQGLEALGNNTTSPKLLLERCVRERNGLELGRFLEYWKRLLRVRSAFAKYENLANYDDRSNTYRDVKKVLTKALAASVLGRQVMRNEEVVPGAVPWWELEWSGAAALTTHNSLAIDDPGVGVGDVKLCPLVIQALVQKETMYRNWGPVQWGPEPGWALKEMADALSVLLRAFLLQEAYQEVEFRVADLVPPGTFMPSAMKHMLLRMEPVRRLFELFPHRHQVTSLEALRQHGASGVLGPGADWYIFLDGITIFGQSKLSLNQDNVTIEQIMKSFERDVSKFFPLPAVSPEGERKLQEAMKLREVQHEEEALPKRTKRQCRQPDRLETPAGMVSITAEEQPQPQPPVRVIAKELPVWLEKLPVLYFYCSTKPIPDTTLMALEILQDVHCWARHLVVLHEREALTRNDALSILHLNRLGV